MARREATAGGRARTKTARRDRETGWPGRAADLRSSGRGAGVDRRVPGPVRGPGRRRGADPGSGRARGGLCPERAVRCGRRKGAGGRPGRRRRVAPAPGPRGCWRNDSNGWDGSDADRFDRPPTPPTCERRSARRRPGCWRSCLATSSPSCRLALSNRRTEEWAEAVRCGKSARTVRAASTLAGRLGAVLSWPNRWDRICRGPGSSALWRGHRPQAEAHPPRTPAWQARAATAAATDSVTEGAWSAAAIEAAGAVDHVVESPREGHAAPVSGARRPRGERLAPRHPCAGGQHRRRTRRAPLTSAPGAGSFRVGDFALVTTYRMHRTGFGGAVGHRLDS